MTSKPMSERRYTLMTVFAVLIAYLCGSLSSVTVTVPAKLPQESTVILHVSAEEKPVSVTDDSLNNLPNRPVPIPTTVTTAENFSGSTSESAAQNFSDNGANGIDFAALQAQNPDIVAWLDVPNTHIHAPVSQPGTGRPDDYYLSHDVSRRPDADGSIYIEKKTAKDFSDRHSVIYGHNNSDGTVFRELHLFENRTFFEQNTTFTVTVPGHILTYSIFAAYEFDNRHLLNTVHTESDADWAEYWREAKAFAVSPHYWRSDIPIDANDFIVTLSTCSDKGHAYRYLVQGVLTGVAAA